MSTDTPLSGGWVQTHTGLKYHVTDPKPSSICIVDIAHSLARQCRYNGHTTLFYSVAEHSILIADALHSKYKNPLLSLSGLLHDAHEAYLGDLPAPVRPFIEGYDILVKIADEAIAEKFGVPYPAPFIVKSFDQRILVDEKKQLMANPNLPWSIDSLNPLGVELKCWNSSVAKRKFLEFYNEMRRQLLQ